MNKSEMMKQLIITTAFKLFQEQGYTKVTVDAIAAACGITKPTFYNKFRSKDDLIASYFKQMTEDLSLSMVSMAEEDSYWGRIIKGYKTLMDWSLQFGHDMYSQLFITNLKTDRGTFNLSIPLAKTMITLIEKAQDAGQIRNPRPAEDLYTASVHLTYGYGVYWCIKGGNFDLFPQIKKALGDLYDVAPELE